MNRPWQIWSVFALCAGVALAAMGWLTMETLHVDRQLIAAQADAELEQEISLTLWRMDTKLAPLIAEEVARPPSFFLSQPELVTEDTFGAQQAARPPSRFNLPANVFLNFDVTAAGIWSCPQVPSAAQAKQSRENGQSLKELAALQAQFSLFCEQVKIEDLVVQLPEQQLPSAQPSAGQAMEQSFYAANPAEITAPSKLSKGGNYLQARNRRYQDVAQQELRKQRGGYDGDYGQQTEPNGDEGGLGQPSTQAPTSIVESVSRPIWVDDKLLLARRILRDGQTAVQGSWLDWPSLKKELLAEASERIPDADLRPVYNGDAAQQSRMLAGLPVQLVVATAANTMSTSSPIRWALRVGWGALLLAVAAVAGLLWGVIALSERRAAFVSSVTHELRTPLTTFRMYSDMLVRGMVPDAERRQQYLETLNLEAQRLSHLVENVLSYARLERGRGPSSREQLAVGDLIERLKTRLTERASQAEMELQIELSGEIRKRQLTTDVSVVEQVLFNLVDNAAKYAERADDRRIHCEVQAATDEATFSVRDHGPGFDKKRRAMKPRPFSKSSEEAAVTAPGVGLGLALCGRLAKQLGGRLDIAGDNEGAVVTLHLPLSGPPKGVGD